MTNDQAPMTKQIQNTNARNESCGQSDRVSVIGSLVIGICL
jgi:hypothetical protein